MTEQKENAAVVEESGDTVKTASQAKQKNHSGKTSLVLSAVAIAIALAAGFSVYQWSKQQVTTQISTNDELASQITALQKAQNEQKDALGAIIKQQTVQLEEAKSRQNELEKQLSEIQNKVAAISGSDSQTWLLAQADFLVKLAGRKLWSDQDVTSAAALLKSADASLADMNDPSLITARRTLTEDIASLSAVSQVDYDGIILKVNQLANQVDNLHLADNSTDDTPMDSDDGELSASLSEWRVNLQKSWQNFMDNFITIRRRDETAVPLLAPNQDIYLRENIRAQLLAAAQAIPRHQAETYKQALDNVSTWVRSYYDTQDAATKAFLGDIDNLSQQDIEMDIPETLQSQSVLDKLMQTRVRNLLAQPTTMPSATTTPETPQASTSVSTQGE